MSDESFADPLSYDDTPYERQVLDDSATQETSLKKRIGNRIYLFEDSLSKKRKRRDDDEDKAEGETNVADNADTRPNALLLQGPAITQMPTSRVFAYATHFDAYPIGLEWVDDQTCVLVFSNRKGALHAFDALRKQTAPTHDETTGMEIDNADELLHSAHAVPLALYPIEDRINSVLGTKKLDILKQPIQMRWARPSDVKERGARDKSEFYKKFGETAGKNVTSGSSNPVGIRNGNDGDVRRRLDAQLDSFQDENRVFDLSRERPSSVVVDARRRNEEERRRRLDYELDAFLASGGDDLVLENGETSQGGGELSSRPSLLERTRRTSRSRSPPARHRREASSLKKQDLRNERENPPRQYQTDSNGRWLHNAEVAQMRRRRDDYDTEVFGMRAWDDERVMPRRRQRRVRKTQDDLDKELEEFGRQESVI